MTEPEHADRRHQLFAVELRDTVGPRRRPDRPNIYLAITVSGPAERFRFLTSHKGRGVVHDHGLRLRTDLTRNFGPTDRADAGRQLTKLRRRLLRQGYAVNGDRRVWRLYVIELDDAVGPRNGDKPWVYVGESSLEPSERFDQHMRGARNARGRLFSPVVRDHGVRLRADLVGGEATLYTQEESKAAEGRLAERLRAEGYLVEGGH